ncbi:MAG: sigma-70 family RNA polymerase sigma factor [Haliscomenobacteraceae bacterium CHB4]|nr:sigma-70 family RNA polymerase sigma factor [Haliscomenobacteraceae bacterium CHB4]
MPEQTKRPLKNPASFTDDQIIQALLGSEQQREMVFAYIYRSSGWREWVVRHVAGEGGDEPAGEDVFQETLILFDRNIREGRFSRESALQTYFLGIAKQYWFNRRRNIRPVPLAPDYDQPVSENPERIALQHERQNMIEQIIHHLGDHCKKVLELYKLSLSNEEIAQELGLSSPEMAKKYTYRCREKFKAFVLDRKDILDHLDIRLDNE